MRFTIGASSPNRHKPWSAEDEIKLYDTRSSDMPWPVIAKALGRTQKPLCDVEEAAGLVNQVDGPVPF